MKKLTQFIFLICCISCSNNKDSQSTDINQINTEYPIPSTYTIKKNISIPCDTLPSIFDFSSLYKRGDSLLYIGLHRKTNGLYLFDIKNEKFVKQITLPKNGVNSITISDFDYVSADSIFLVSDDQNKLLLINNNGEVLENRILSSSFNDNKSIGWIESASGKRLSWVKELGLLAIPTFPELDYADSEFYNHGFLTLYSFEEDSIIDVLGSYPDAYGSNDKSYFPLGMNFNFTDTHPFYLSFLNSHRLFGWNDETKSLETIADWRSADLPAEFDRMKVSHDFQDELNYVNTCGFYFKTIVDSENATAYRVVKHGQTLKDDEGLFNQYNQSDWSILSGFIDRSKSKLSETRFEGGKYRFVDIHLIKENEFLVSLENEYNMNNGEDFLEFEWIVLK